MPDDRETKCPVCGGSDWRTVMCGDGFRIDGCLGGCIGRTVPPPRFEETPSPPAASDDAPPVDDPVSGHFRLASELLTPVSRFRPSGRLLDVGCGWGHLLKLASDAGYEVTGLDASPRAAEVTRTTFGVDPIVGFFPGHDFGECSFDVVTMNHVLEHLPDPVSALEEAARILKPGGILAVGVPNFDGLMRRVRGPAWQGIQPSQHVWQLSVRSVARLVRNAGLECVVVKSCSLEYPRGPRALPKWIVLRSCLAIAAILRSGDNAVVLARKHAEVGPP